MKQKKDMSYFQCDDKHLLKVRFPHLILKRTTCTRLELFLHTVAVAGTKPIATGLCARVEKTENKNSGALSNDLF